MARGKLIVFEGIDGAGKSSQVRAVQATLSHGGREVVSSREPTDGPFGRKLRSSAREGRLEPAQELELFILDRKHHIQHVIEPALARGATVLLDRYYLSTVAYQSQRGHDPQALLEEHYRFAPRPDLVLLFDVFPETAMERLRARGNTDHFEKYEVLTKIRRVYLDIDRKLGGTDEIVKVIDADSAPGNVFVAVMREIARVRWKDKP